MKKLEKKISISHLRFAFVTALLITVIPAFSMAKNPEYVVGSSTSSNMIHLAHTLFDAMEAGDTERLTAIFTDDALIWRNFENRNQPVNEAIAQIKRTHENTKQLQYIERRYIPVPSGVIAQHIVRVKLLNGEILNVPAMLHLYILHGRVQRIEEYYSASDSQRIRGGVALTSPCAD